MEKVKNDKNKFDSIIMILKNKKRIKNSIIKLDDIYEEFFEGNSEEYLEFLTYIEKKGYTISSYSEDEDYQKIKISDDITKSYIKEVYSIPLFTEEEEKYYFNLYQNVKDKKIKNYIAEHNLRLVVSIARKNCNKGIEFLDLIQAGNEGLLKAIDNFDPSQGVKFSTYATWWIRSYISRDFAGNSKVINLSNHLHLNVVKVLNIKEKLAKETGREPSIKEISDASGYTEKEVLKYLSCDIKIISIDTPISPKEEKDEILLGDVIVDESGYVENGVVSNLCVSEFWNIAKEILSEKQYYVLSNKYSKEFEIEKTQEEIAKTLGITRQSVSLLELKAIEKCRENIKIRNLI